MAAVQHFLRYATLHGNARRALWPAFLLTYYCQRTAEPSLNSRTAHAPRCSLGEPRKNLRAERKNLVGCLEAQQTLRDVQKRLAERLCQNGGAVRISMLTGLMHTPHIFLGPTAMRSGKAVTGKHSALALLSCIPPVISLLYCHCLLRAVTQRDGPPLVTMLAAV